MACRVCGWPEERGHERGCVEVDAARSWPGDVEHIPCLCVAIVHRDNEGKERVVEFVASAGNEPDTVAISLPMLRSLLARSNAEVDPMAVDQQLRRLSAKVEECTGVAALATAALDRFVKAVEAERADPYEANPGAAPHPHPGTKT